MDEKMPKQKAHKKGKGKLIALLAVAVFGIGIAVYATQSDLFQGNLFRRSPRALKVKSPVIENVEPIQRFDLKERRANEPVLKQDEDLDASTEEETQKLGIQVESLDSNLFNAEFDPSNVIKDITFAPHNVEPVSTRAGEQNVKLASFEVSSDSGITLYDLHLSLTNEFGFELDLIEYFSEIRGFNENDGKLLFTENSSSTFGLDGAFPLTIQPGEKIILSFYGDVRLNLPVLENTKVGLGLYELIYNKEDGTTVRYPVTDNPETTIINLCSGVKGCRVDEDETPLIYIQNLNLIR